MPAVIYNRDLLFEVRDCAVQACIMAVGGTRHRVLLKDGQPHAESYLTVTLSADHRVYDGEIAGAFLNAFCNNMSNPVKLLL